jgi:hypothetical protein
MLGGKIKKVIMKPIGTTKISVNPEWPSITWSHV